MLTLYEVVEFLLFQILSRAKPAADKGAAAAAQAAKEKQAKAVPKLDDFLQARDYTGAITLLEVRIMSPYELAYYTIL